MTPKRQKAEDLVYKYMDAVDKTGSNTTYYKRLFSTMSDKQFEDFCKKDLPFRFHTRVFDINPTMTDIKKGLDVLKVPLLEKIALPYLYENKQGQPVMSPPGMVFYIHLKKMKQFITKKNAMSTGRDTRDMKTGLLVSIDKNGKTSDREMEALNVMGLDKTFRELSTWRADYMDSKDQAYQQINLTGQIVEDDIIIDKQQSLAKNMLNSYMVAAGLYTNILNKDYMTPYTLNNRQKKVERETA